MPLIFYLLGIFAVAIYGGQPTPSGQARTAQNIQNQLPQQARQTLAYVSALNDWRYDHPLQNGTITASQLGIPFSGHLKNQVVSNRLWVWQPAKPGLFNALLAESGHSALTGQVRGRRLFDATNTDMQVTVPDAVPDGSLVCLN
ncbi:type IV pilus biogenesis protein PilM [Salmonella enterica]|nr:pilus assembly protein PilM [Salmonella enterica]EHN5211388.1 type IV pilus biogenesis protein PilM [Salmonella enterica subsp. enterica serovar Baildon]EDS3116641.1 type IV pilus biogenesis protein PilM [Salmonella enterica]EHN5626096.1 type IV pilus biogenesis protein PilM [Salmonella enterica subsp. enterica serovar Baildon]EIP0210975.1 type IV pilus biogenesis protein PilM [Salmonella enterica]